MRTVPCASSINKRFSVPFETAKGKGFHTARGLLASAIIFRCSSAFRQTRLSGEGGLLCRYDAFVRTGTCCASRNRSPALRVCAPRARFAWTFQNHKNQACRKTPSWTCSANSPPPAARRLTAPGYSYPPPIQGSTASPLRKKPAIAAIGRYRPVPTSAPTATPTSPTSTTSSILALRLRPVVAVRVATPGRGFAFWAAESRRESG
jgi:hypothetical protein